MLKKKSLLILTVFILVNTLLYLTGGIYSPIREIYYYGLVAMVLMGGRKLGLCITLVNSVGFIVLTLENPDASWNNYLWFMLVSLFTVWVSGFVKKEVNKSIAVYTKQNEEINEQWKEKEHLLKELQCKAHDLKEFYHMSLELATCQDQGQVNQGLIKWAERIVSCSWVALYVLEDTKLKMKNASNTKEEEARDFLEKGGEKFISTLINTNIPVIENNPSFNLLFKNKDILEILSIKSIIAVPITVKGKNNGVLILFNQENKYSQDDVDKLTTMANHSATVMEVAILHSEKTNLFYQTLTSLAAAIDAKDSYTKGHSEKVTHYATTIGKELGLNRKQMESLKYASLLHDIGKIGIPDAILNKPEKLDDGEFEVIKGHPELSYHIIKDIDFLNDTLDGIRYHHERMDGRGYPKGLQGDQIPLIARILSVADAFDAMTSKRVYSTAKSTELSILELQSCSGTQFDAKVVDAFVNALSDKSNC